MDSPIKIRRDLTLNSYLDLLDDEDMYRSSPPLICPSIPSPEGSPFGFTPLHLDPILSPEPIRISPAPALLQQPEPSSARKPHPFSEPIRISSAPALPQQPPPARKPHPFSIDALLFSTATPAAPSPHPGCSSTPPNSPAELEPLNFTVSRTKRNKPLILIAGQRFYLQLKNKHGTLIFVCSRKRSLKCSVSLTMDCNLSTILRFSGCHNHA